MASSLAKASILNLDSGDKAVDCLFNPKEYTFQKQNSWPSDQTAGTNVPKLEFGGGQPATLQMELIFDTYTENSSGGPATDVRKKYTDAIWALMMVDDSLKDPKTQKSRPPKVRFQWGRTWTFDAVITSITQRFTLFTPDGTPVRAVLSVTFQQIKDEKQLSPQNPTSRGDGGERVVTVVPGDTLMNLAHAMYGDTKKWRLIADANKLMNVRRLAPGTVLEIPNA